MSNRRLPSANAPGGALGDVISELHAQGHLSPRLVRTAQAFLFELQTSHGRSHGLVGDIRTKVDAGRREMLRPPGGASVAVLDQRLHRLRPHERELLRHLAACCEKPAGALTAYARARCGFSEQSRAKAFAIGRLTGLLESLADLYFGPIKLEA